MDITFSHGNKPGKGSLLISDPFQSDEYFTRSVILLCDHNEEGSFGFVLNNFLDMEKDVLKQFIPNNQQRVSIGGPVDMDNLYYMHNHPELIADSVHVYDDLHIGGKFQNVTEEIAKDSTLPIRFFLGYSGWAPGQLDEEIQRNCWVVCNTYDINDILSPKEVDLWKKYLKTMGKKFELMADFPLNPNDN